MDYSPTDMIAHTSLHQLWISESTMRDRCDDLAHYCLIIIIIIIISCGGSSSSSSGSGSSGSGSGSGSSISSNNLFIYLFIYLFNACTYRCVLRFIFPAFYYFLLDTSRIKRWM